MRLASFRATSCRRPMRARPELHLALAALLVLLTPLGAMADRVLGTHSTDRHEVRVVEVAAGLRHPWSIAFLPGGDILVTERSGRLLRLDARSGRRTAVAGVPPVFAYHQGGLFDVALDPEFAENGRIYLSYAAEKRGGANTRLARARLEGARLENLEIIFDAMPGRSGGRHFGGRIAFLPDGTVTLTTGDRGEKTPSQNLMDHSGSVIRVHRDGRVPEDNPFVGRGDVKPEIYTYGHRNPQGAAIHPQTGQLWTQEHGPRGGDEVNIKVPGENYGWPLVSHGQNYSGTPVGTGEAAAPGITDPVYVWVPSIAPSGMTFYTGNAFPKWEGNLFVGALKYQLVTRLTLDGNRVVSEERFLNRAYGRIRDVREGPDGMIYLLTDAREGRLLRLEPAD